MLCGKASYANVSGTVRFNGVEGNYEDYKTVMGFVPQDDVVHEARALKSLKCFHLVRGHGTLHGSQSASSLQARYRKI